MSDHAINNWQTMTLAASLPTRLAPRQILVVEDDLGLQPVLYATLHAIDPKISVDWRTSVDQVLTELHQNWRALRAYDVIIADIHLPGFKSGLELLQACRFNCPAVRFIVMSGMSPTEFSKKTAGQGWHLPFLHKPFNPKDCIRLVGNALNF